MPKALLVNEFGSLNGGENSLLALVPSILAAGWTLEALVPAASPLSQQLQQAGVKCRSISFHDRNGRRKPLEQQRQELADAIRAAAPDLVHCNSLNASRIAGPADRHGAAALGYLRDIIKLSRQAVEDLNQMDCLIAVSEATRASHVKQGIHGPSLQVIHNGVDLQLFSPAAASGYLHRQLGLQPGVRLVLFVGQIGLRKGLNSWMSIAESIAAEDSQCQFVIVGQRHSQKQESIVYERDLRLRSEDGLLKNRVHWLGRRTDVASIMRESAVLLHCARQEPLGRVLLEAFASGLPVVASNVGGTSEIFCDEAISHLMFPIDNEFTAVKSVKNLLNDHQLHVATSRVVRRIAEESFTIHKCSEQLLAQYHRLLD